MASSHLTREDVVLTWLKRSISDFFFAFKVGGSFVRYEPFFNYMGLELICKSYLLGCRAADYEGLPLKKALSKVDQIAKKELAHKLSTVIQDIQQRKPSGNITQLLSEDFDGFSGTDFVKTLESVYLECRYPVPEPVSKQFPIPGQKGMFRDPVYSSGLAKFCYATAREILTYISDDFSIKVPQTFLRGLKPRKKYRRFQRLFFKGQMKKLVGRK